MHLLSIFLLLVNSYLYNPDDWLQISALQDIRAITADPFSIYIIYRSGIGFLNKADRKLVRAIVGADGIPSDILLGGYDPELGVIWLVTRNLLVSYNPTTRQNLSFSHSMTNVSSLGIGPKYVYLATDQRVIRFSKSTHGFLSAPTLDPLTIWYGARSPYKPRNYIFLTPYYYTDRNFRRYDIVALFEDNNTLWVATNGYGLFSYDLFTKIPYHYQFGPAAGSVLKIFSDRSGLWFTSPDDISFYNPKADTWSYYDLAVRPLSSLQSILLKPPVYDLIRREYLLSVVVEDSIYWLGTVEGLYSFEPRSEVLTSELDTRVTIRKIFIEGDSIFLATDRGLFFYSKKDRSAAQITDPSGKLNFGVYDIAAAAGMQFFACTGGLMVFDTASTWQFRQIPGVDLTSHPDALAAIDDFLFVAAGTELLAYDESRNIFQRLDSNTGMPLNSINALYADKNYLWLGTNDGVTRFSYHSLFPYRR